jgi:hypothetical protein
MKYQILLIAWLLPLSARAATLDDLRAKLAYALGAYCVPKDVETCVDAEIRATYDPALATGNKCRCPCDDQYYDEDLRKCIDCQYGSSGRYATECKIPSCPAGEVFVYFDNECPPGSYYRDDVATCPVGTYLVETSNRSCDAITQGQDAAGCPAGLYMYNY